MVSSFESFYQYENRFCQSESPRLHTTKQKIIYVYEGEWCFFMSEWDSHALNHRLRRSLLKKNAYRKYFFSSRLRYGKRKQKEVYDWIKNLVADESVRLGKDKITPAAWQISARKWMEKNRLVFMRNKTVFFIIEGHALLGSHQNNRLYL